MKFLLPIMMTDPAQYLPLARAAEEQGFHGVILADSIAYPKDSDSKYPHTKDGDRSFLDGAPFIEPIVAMAAMGAVTTELEFYTGVLKLPIRHPVLLAKQLSSLAVLTNNRVNLGVGLSPWPEDFSVTGVPWKNRGRRMDEMIDIIRGLLAGEYFGWDGDHFSIPDIKLNPVPNKPLPILIGGHSPAAFERAGARGDGWISVGGKPAEMAEAVTAIKKRRAELGHEDDFAFVAAGRSTATATGVTAMIDAGATHIVADYSTLQAYDPGKPRVPLEQNLAELATYVNTVMRNFQ